MHDLTGALRGGRRSWGLKRWGRRAALWIAVCLTTGFALITGGMMAPGITARASDAETSPSTTGGIGAPQGAEVGPGLFTSGTTTQAEAVAVSAQLPALPAAAPKAWRVVWMDTQQDVSVFDYDKTTTAPAVIVRWGSLKASDGNILTLVGGMATAVSVLASRNAEETLATTTTRLGSGQVLNQKTITTPTDNCAEDCGLTAGGAAAASSVFCAVAFLAGPPGWAACAFAGGALVGGAAYECYTCASHAGAQPPSCNSNASLANSGGGSAIGYEFIRCSAALTQVSVTEQGYASVSCNCQSGTNTYYGQSSVQDEYDFSGFQSGACVKFTASWTGYWENPDTHQDTNYSGYDTSNLVCF